MRTRLVLVCLNLIVSALSWSLWIVIGLPFWGLPFWIALSCQLLGSCLFIALTPSALPWIVLASGLSAFGGIVVKFEMHPQSGPLVFPPHYIGVVGAIFVTVANLAAGMTTVMIRKLPQTLRLIIIWALMLACVALGPLIAALAML